MKKLISVFALAAFTFGMAQETPKKNCCDGKGKKECKLSSKKDSAASKKECAASKKEYAASKKECATSKKECKTKHKKEGSDKKAA